MQGKAKLRTGYTTGACAAAAAKAAALAVCGGKPVTEVPITLPCGKCATFAVSHSAILEGASASATVVKDAGDDPDVTHGARITATVALTTSPAISIEGGEGVARVTREGLGLAVGSAAINPVPRSNIAAMVTEALTESPWHGAQVVIRVADGLQMAKGTINERLGLVGGISILGTSGIVRPFSTAAFIGTIETAITVARAAFLDRLVFTTGTRSERFAMAALPALPPQAFVQVADFMGAALEMALGARVARVDICVMIGKLSKLAGGHLATHVKDASIDLPFLARMVREAGIAADKAEKCAAAVSGRALFDILDGGEMQRVGRLLCAMARTCAMDHVGGGLQIRLVLFDFDGRIVAEKGG